jgi:hypothetical protein
MGFAALNPSYRYFGFGEVSKCINTDPYNRDTLQPEFVLELARNKYADIEPFLKFGREINQQFSHPAGQVAALIYSFAKRDSDKAIEFVKAWRRGDRNGRYQIIDTMQQLLHSQRANNNGRIHELARAGIIIRAWNIFRAGQKGSLAQLQAALTTEIEKIS